MKFPVRMVGKHGAMHAYSTSEVAHLQSLGWSVEVPEPLVVPAAQVLKAALAESMQLDPPVSDLVHRGPVPDAQPLPAAVGETSVAPLAEPRAKRKPGRPRKGE